MTPQDPRPTDQDAADRSQRDASAPPRKEEPNPLVLMGVAAELGLVVAGLTLLGWWVDGMLGTGPWLTVTGAAMGIVGGMYNLWRVGRRFFE